MKIRGLLIAVCLGASALVVSAGDYKSVSIAPGSSLTDIPVTSDGFMLIRNFTQEGGSTRGLVTVSVRGGPQVSVLAASIIDTDPTTVLEVVNSIIIAGPSRVSATCPSDATSCVITYRKTGGDN